MSVRERSPSCPHASASSCSELPDRRASSLPRLWVPLTSGASWQSTRGLQTVHVTEPGPESETQ